MTHKPVIDVYRPALTPHGDPMDGLRPTYVADILIPDGDCLWHIGETAQEYKTPKGAETAGMKWFKSAEGQRALRQHKHERRTA